MKIIKSIVLALFITNVHAITPFYEISPQANHRIVAMALSENGVCWLETVTEQQLRIDKWLNRVSPLQVKAVEYQNSEVYERLLWQENSAIGNTIYNDQIGTGYLRLTYTNLNLIPRTQTMTVALQNQRWVNTNRPQQVVAPIQSLSLSIQDNGELILPSPSPIVKSCRLIQENKLEIAIAAKVGHNKIRFALPLRNGFSPKVFKSLEQQWQRGYLEMQASTHRRILVWGDANQKVVLSMPTFDRLLIQSLENHVDELSYRQNGINQMNAVKFFNLMTLWRDQDEWTMAQRLEVDRFLATKAEQLKNTLLALPMPNSEFTLLFSAWDKLAQVIPQTTHLQIMGTLSVLELPNQKTVYYIKGSLPNFVPTAQQQKGITAWMAHHLGTTPQLIIGAPPVSTVRLTQVPDTLASLEITTLHLAGNQISLVASLDSREAKVFERFLTQGMILEMRLNTDILGFEVKTQQTIPLAIQVKPEAMTTVLVDQDYPIVVEVSNQRLEKLFQRDKAPAIQINYQGRIKTIPLSADNSNYTVHYALKRDRQHDPIYRFQWRIKLAEQTTPWQRAEFPYVLIGH
ncbi:MAG: hypothetical protein DRR19_05295 [Candidatus Parabeggiatoa sp. nov. 1]|nr:MAG: hypothetical protein DRR19_05295 [Gammaproteobacteria bacterium]